VTIEDSCSLATRAEDSDQLSAVLSSQMDWKTYKIAFKDGQKLKTKILQHLGTSHLQ